MNDSESLRFNCPLCGQRIECTGAWAGVDLDCPACSKRIRAPSSVTAAMPYPVTGSGQAAALPVRPSQTGAEMPAPAFQSWIGYSGGKPLAVHEIVSPRLDHAEELRQTHLSYEQSVKSVGLLYYMAGCLLGTLGLMVASDLRQSRYSESPRLAGTVVVITALALLSAGFGLRKLRPWSRYLSSVISGIGLLAFPAGTIINAYILYLLFSQNGATIFSELYQRVIAATPHIKSRTPILLWIVLGIVVGVCLVVAAWVFYLRLSGLGGR